MINNYYILLSKSLQRMTAHEGYVWFLPSWYSDDWWDVDYYNSPPSHGDNRPQEHIPCNTENMEYAIEGYFILQKTFSDPDSTKVIGGIEIRDYKMQYAQRVGKAVNKCCLIKSKEMFKCCKHFFPIFKFKYNKTKLELLSVVQQDFAKASICVC